MDILLMFPKERRNKRMLKPFVVPLFTLYEQTSKLLNCIQQDTDVRSRVSSANRRNIKQLLSIIQENGLHKNCDLALIRDRLAAHVDDASAWKTTPIWEKVDISKFLIWARMLLETISKLQPVLAAIP
jgi:hypothetical protein